MKAEKLSAARRRELEGGEGESANLQEWLAVDMGALLKAVLREADRKAPESTWLETVRALPVTRRVETIALHLLDRHADLHEALSVHASDTVRIWAAMMVGLGPKRALRRRLEELRPFAADPHFGVREYAWMAFRPHLSGQLVEGLDLLLGEASHEDERVRRFASEVSRPRGVWCAHLQALRQDPDQARPLLERLKADPSRYVQTSVANWINDASKDQPAWTKALAEAWIPGAPASTAWILAHGLRTLRKKEAWGLA